MAADTTKVELRIEIPRWVADVLDAESIACGTTRNQQVLMWLKQWCGQRVQAYRLGARLTGINPAASGRGGDHSDDMPDFADSRRGGL